MLTTPIFKKSLRVEQFQGNYLNFEKNTSNTSFCFFETSKLVSPQFLLFTLFCFREKNREKNLTTNLNKFCLHAVAGFATHCANRHGALHHYIKI